MHVHVQVQVQMHVHVHVHVHTRVHMCVHLRVHLHVHVCSAQELCCKPTSNLISLHPHSPFQVPIPNLHFRFQSLISISGSNP